MTRPHFTFLLAAVSLLALPSAHAKSNRTGEVYLFRGLANVFSTGLDTIGKDLRDRGIDARIYNHTAWPLVANSIVARSQQPRGISYPIIIMGHSFGADCSIKMANYLGSRGIKVAYVATFDPTHHAAIGPNVGTLQNFYVSSSPGPNSYRHVQKAPGFRGKLENDNLSTKSQFDSVHHFNIEKNVWVQQQVTAKAYSLTSRKRS